MANTFAQSDANDSNEEMNPAANSSVAEDGILATGNKGNEDTQSDSKPHIQKSETEGKGVNPGRTPGKAEGVEDAEESGNQ